MKMTRLRAVTVLAASLVGMSGIALQAQPESDTRHHGYEHGYRDGFALGRDARTRGVAPDTKGDAYRNADHGYRSEFGPREDFETGYREGYRQGADDGYANQTDRFEKMFGSEAAAVPNARNGSYDVASEIGYRDGVKAGIKDAKDRHSFRPTEHDQWRDADRGYQASLGSKEDFKMTYRKGYEAGYKDGYGPPR